MKFKKILATVLSFVMILSTMTFAVSAETTVLNGAGTETDPFMINSVEDLLFFRDSVNAGEIKYNTPGTWVALGADIDLNGTAWERGIGDGIKATFDGNFDGRGYSIKNLVVEPKADADDYLCGGLFGYTYGGVTIQNLILENVSVTTDDAGFNVGALVGFANNNGGKANIYNITLTGKVVIDAPNAYGVGTIVGYSYRDMGTIDNCVVDADNGSYISGYSFVGGITGYSYSNAVISNCSVNNVDITATSYSVGGIVGLANPNVLVKDCDVADVTVDGQANVGMILGAVAGSNIVLEGCKSDTNDPTVGGNYSDNAPVVAAVNGTSYTTIEEALQNFKEGDTLTLYADSEITAGKGGYSKAGIVMAGGVIDGNGHKLTVNGANSTWDCAIYTTGGTIKNITVAGAMRGVFSAGTSEDIILDNVKFEDVIYTFNSDNGNKAYEVIIKNSTLNGWTSYSNVHALVTFENCTFGEGSGYAYFRPYGPVKLVECDFSEDYEIDTTKVDTVELKDCTVAGEPMDAETLADLLGGAVAVAGDNSYTTIKAAIENANDDVVVTLLQDVTVEEGITNKKDITLDLNGKTITGTDSSTGSFALITNRANLTITGNGTMTLTALNNRGWNGYSSVISNTVGGKLVVENGTIEHLGGTDMAYAIDNLTNGKGTYAETIINGGTINSTYRGIRQFLNGVNAENILEVNGGTITGANKSIWMQDPSKNANSGTLTVTDGATLNGDVYLFVTAGSTEWPVAVSIAYDSLAEGSNVLTANIPKGYDLIRTGKGYEVTTKEAEQADTISVVYKDVTVEGTEGEKTYEVIVKANDGDVINELASVDLTFAYTTDPVTGGAIDFTVAPADKFAMTRYENTNRYMFNYNGVGENYEGTANEITVATITVTGYGEFTIGTKDLSNEEVDTNVVNATTVNDNLVDSYTVAGATDNDVTTGALDITGNVASEIAVPVRTLTINLDFPNAVEDNEIAYQDMKVEITGVFDGVNKTVTYNLGKDGKYAMANGNYVVIEDKLVLNNAYTVTVSGAGYRTARYTVTMTEDKTLKFWNNVMDEAQFVEIGKESSKVNVTFLAGDIVKDNKINIYDLSAVVSYFGSVSTTENGYAKYDLNRDEVIDSKDVAYVLVSWGN